MIILNAFLIKLKKFLNWVCKKLRMIIKHAETKAMPKNAQTTAPLYSSHMLAK